MGASAPRQGAESSGPRRGRAEPCGSSAASRRSSSTGREAAPLEAALSGERNERARRQAFHPVHFRFTASTTPWRRVHFPAWFLDFFLKIVCLSLAPKALRVKAASRPRAAVLPSFPFGCTGLPRGAPVPAVTGAVHSHPVGVLLCCRFALCLRRLLRRHYRDLAEFLAVLQFTPLVAHLQPCVFLTDF